MKATACCALILAGFWRVAAADVHAILPCNRVITLEWLTPDALTIEDQPQRFTLSSPSRHAPAVLSVGADRQVKGFRPDGKAVIATRLHLRLSGALRPGVQYRLFDARKALPITGLPLRYDPNGISPSIQVDQVGYLRNSVKLAYVGNWLGTLGAMPLPDDSFRVERADDSAVVMEGTLSLRAQADRWSGNDVWTADFSGLNTPGRYRLNVPGLGISHSFEVGDDIYAPVYRRVARLFYHSRNGMPIVAPWADPGYERPAGGIRAKLDGVFHPVVGTSAFGRGERAGDYRAIQGGWFDAGDYGQYLTNAAPVWYSVAAGFDIAGSGFGGDDLGIPESGNGIPDLIDELAWGFRWASAMQDSADGGVYWRLASAHWDESAPVDVDTPRFIFEKTTHATASFAALAAIHARLIAPYDAAQSKSALSAALRAWAFIETHPQWPEEGEVYRNPPGVAAGTYPDKSATDNRLWAAAELLRTTGEKRFAQAFEHLIGEQHFDPTMPVSFKHQGMAALWAYLHAPDTLQRPEFRELARHQFIAGADWLIRMAEENPFHAPSHHRLQTLGWGGFGQSTRAVLPLLQAHQLSRQTEYQHWARRMPHPQLGANPLSRSFITGVGAKPPLHPLSKLSVFDSIAAPLSGIPVPGPHYRLGRAWDALARVDDSYLPAGDGDTTPDFPALRRYVDASPLPPMSEATVAEIAQAAVGFALLSQIK
ncbi:MAG: glycoside hydrolase family 9 protein [Gammaproteobacteria bacterium]|nr:glycoside hydrolase family 9 protein [Gammaproteobacteria bacterium]MCP5136675.1 glycoside hydrolase family 9 protein [Gammaproteobacteria bacterium]